MNQTTPCRFKKKKKLFWHKVCKGCVY